MSTNIVIEKGEVDIELIRAAATDVMAEVENDDGDTYLVSRKLEQLRDTLAEARRLGLSEEAVEKTLEEVRQSSPDVAESWSELLEQLTVFVWLEDPDGNRVRGDTVTIDRFLWENHDEDILLEDTVQQLRDDLEVGWELVEGAI
jgi:hypothetical protein